MLDTPITIETMFRHVYFITHPNVVISAHIPVLMWPLSALGRQRMAAVMRQPWAHGVTSIYSSVEQKAIDGAEILAMHLSLSVNRVKELGENDRASTGYLPASEFEAHADEFFASSTVSVRGWERAIDAQQRIVKVLETITRDDKNSGDIAIVSHGAVGALLYCYLAGVEISRRWDQPSNGGGNYFAFDVPDGKPLFGWRAVDGGEHPQA